ncbi:MAG: EAL domain-containing protein [Hyphomonadaceae bacterium]|nr:EAL domain-containing protein [Hyphomonadaceae bacterium]
MSITLGGQGQYNHDLRRLTLSISGVLTLFGLILLWVVAYAGLSANRDAVQRERQLIENALDQAVSRVLNEEKAIAWWDDAVVNAQMRPLDLDWIETNIGVYFYETYGHDEIYLLDGSNTPIYANIGGELNDEPVQAYARRAAVLEHVVMAARGFQDPSLRLRDAAFTADQQRYSFLLGASNASWSGHIFVVDGQPAVVSAMAIVPSVDASVLEGAPHLMVSIVRMDEDFMASVGRTLLMPDLRMSPTSDIAEGSVAQPFFADNGVANGYLTWTPRRPGKALLLFILPLVALGVMGAGVLTWMMIRRLKRASEELAQREALSRHEALHDALSGLPNRTHFTRSLQEALDELVQTRNNARVIVAYVDVDRFKDVNDTLGHAAGDNLIVLVAERLRGVVGPTDLLARFGGDEFAILRCSSAPGASDELADRVRAAFEESFDLYGQHVRMTASLGIAAAPDHGATPEELMRHADIALYEAKNAGRDRAMVFSARRAAAVERRREIELDLQTALKQGALALHYQPVVSCGAGKVTGLEALLRWKHPTKGDISPALFVPIAEEAGLMPALGQFVLERAFADSCRWPELEVSINLSPVQFRHVDLVELLATLLTKHAVDPKRIVLEVTEGVLLESSERNRHVLDAIRALGFKIALDDFGTGYSSLRYLSDFRFDKLKIDRGFVTGIHERKRALTIIQSVVTLGRGLGMDIVAEGVETQTEAAVMRLVGVSELQGYYFSPAIPVESVADYIQRHAVQVPSPESVPTEIRALR